VRPNSLRAGLRAAAGLPGVTLAMTLALALPGCIDSTGPILSDAAPAFGPKLRLQVFMLQKGYARDPQQVNFNWNGHLYTNAGSGLREVSAFSIHPFEVGDYVIQTVPAKRARASEYALLHKLAEGVWQLNAIDEADADEATRSAFCQKAGPSSCQIETREQLFAFARATAARPHDNGALVVRLPDGAERAAPVRGPARRAPPRR
jgi:hypothetical protein